MGLGLKDGPPKSLSCTSRASRGAQQRPESVAVKQDSALHEHIHAHLGLEEAKTGPCRASSILRSCTDLAAWALVPTAENRPKSHYAVGPPRPGRSLNL